MRRPSLTRVGSFALAAVLVSALALPRSAPAQCPPGQEFQPGSLSLTSSGSGLGVAVADLNKDGLADIITGNGNSIQVSLQLSGTSPAFATGAYALSAPVVDVAIADFNRDGILDVAASTYGNVAILLGNGSQGVGDGSFGVPQYFTATPSPRRIAVTDMNGDGIPDLIVGAHASAFFSVLIGNGDGTFQPHQDFPGGPSPWGVAVADLNGDGIPDVVATCSYSLNVLEVMLGLGQNGHWLGAFAPPKPYPATGELLGVVLRDVDGDGILDAVCSNAASELTIYRGNGANGQGDGTFRDAVDYPVPGTPYDVDAAPLSATGLPDVIEAIQEGGVRYLRNNGDGTFAASEALALGGNMTDVAFADINHDRAADAIGVGSLGVQLQFGACNAVLPLPIITGFTPIAGQPGTSVTITGAYFDASAQVLFAGHAATVSSVSSGQIVAVVPNDAETGPITVTTTSGSTTSARVFTLGPLPLITEAVPQSAKVGAHVEIVGRYLTTTSAIAFGPASQATFTVLSDTSVDAVVDTLAATGPIHVTTLFGGATSSFDFVLLPPDPYPHIASVRDVPHDQGGTVTVEWGRSDFDEPTRHRITSYRVWRRALPAAGAAALKSAAPGTWLARTAPGASDQIEYWEALATLPAAFLEGYAYTAATTQDSVAGSNPYTAFFVQALTSDPATFYSSAEDSGYSVDNLAPGRPTPFTEMVEHNGVALHWGRNVEPDFADYLLYRASGDFTPSPSNLIATVPDTGYFDASGYAGSSYKLAAVDRHGNASPFAVVETDVATATLLSLASVDVSPPYVRLLWYASTAVGLSATVERRTTDSPWASIASIMGDGLGELYYEDRAPGPARYGYRLRYGAAGDTTAAAWVTVPASDLALAAWPNPAIGGLVRLGVTVLDGPPAMLELLDVSGRVVARRPIDAGTGPTQVITLGAGARLAPGVYQARLRQGAAQKGVRLVVMP